MSNKEAQVPAGAIAKWEESNKQEGLYARNRILAVREATTAGCTQQTMTAGFGASQSAVSRALSASKFATEFAIRVNGNTASPVCRALLTLASTTGISAKKDKIGAVVDEYRAHVRTILGADDRDLTNDEVVRAIDATREGVTADISAKAAATREASRANKGVDANSDPVRPTRNDGPAAESDPGAIATVADAQVKAEAPTTVPVRGVDWTDLAVMTGAIRDLDAAALTDAQVEALTGLANVCGDILTAVPATVDA